MKADTEETCMETNFENAYGVIKIKGTFIKNRKKKFFSITLVRNDTCQWNLVCR